MEVFGRKLLGREKFCCNVMSFMLWIVAALMASEFVVSMFIVWRCFNDCK